MIGKNSNSLQNAATSCRGACRLATPDKDIITPQVQRQRNHKNVITLYGQMASFVVEIVMSTYVIFHALINQSITDPSVMTINTIVTFSVIALTQFFTSHELRRFVKGV